MADETKLTGPSGLHYSELHKPCETGRDARQVGPVVTVDKYQDGKIYVICLNRPHRMNSMGSGLPDALYDAWAEFREDKTARVAILTGRGNRAFCTGGDLIEASERRQAEARGEKVPERGRRRPSLPGSVPAVPLSEGMGLWKPTIAAINGFAVAGGVMYSMQCDIRIAAETAKIGIAEARWNMAGAMWMGPLVRQMHLNHLLEMVLWGDTQWTAQRAYEIGWLNKVVPLEDLMETAMDYAQRAVDMAPRASRNFKQTVYRAFTMPTEVSLAFGYSLDQNLGGMKDSIEGPTAFAEKRRPSFTDS